MQQQPIYMEAAVVHGRAITRFTLRLPERGPVYMSASTEDLSSGTVVVVDAAAFVQLWKNDASRLHSEIANGNPDSWRRDYKFHWAEKGFAQGIGNPVPLAEVVFGWTSARRGLTTLLLDQPARGSAYVSFINGITRTIWLLAHGCSAFPVLCPVEYAEDLQAVAGVRLA